MEEEPKVPISDSRWVALRRCLLVLAPVPITIFLVAIHFKQVVYISAEDIYVGTKEIQMSEVQNAFQLVAGAYGTLIVASVSAMALHRIRYELAERDGVALGYLLAGYQLSHLTTLLSKEFWKGANARSRGGNRLQHISLIVLVSLCMILAHFGSSMGAILLVPKPAWWQVPSKQAQKEGSFVVSGGREAFSYSGSLLVSLLGEVPLSPTQSISSYC